MTIEQFLSQYNGVFVTNPNAPTDNPYQCMQLMHQYCVDVLGLDKSVLSQDTAFDVFKNFPYVNGAQLFQQFFYTANFIPEKGDIVFFGEYLNLTGPAGHVCIFLSGDTKSFVSIDQNWPEKSPVHEQTHTSYNGVVGVLRFKGTTMSDPIVYKGIDVTNIASVEVCIDTWEDVVKNGLYVKKTDIDQKVNDAVSAEQTLANGYKKQYDDLWTLIVQNTPANEVVLHDDATLTSYFQKYSTYQDAYNSLPKIKEDMNAQYQSQILDLEKNLSDLKVQFVVIQAQLDTATKQVGTMTIQIQQAKEQQLKVSNISMIISDLVARIQVIKDYLFERK